MNSNRSGSASRITFVTLIISLITAAGVFILYTGVAPVARITETTTITSTQTSVTTLPVQVLTSTTTLPALTSTATTTLPAQIVSVTQTTTATSVQTTTATTTQITTTTSIQTTTTTSTLTTTSTTTSTVKAATASSLTNKTQLLNNFQAKIGPGTSCNAFPGCMQSNRTLIYSFQATSPGFIVVSGSSDVDCCKVGVSVENNYNSPGNAIACGYNVDCWTLQPPLSRETRRPSLIPILPGQVTLTLTNWGNKTATVNVSAWYYS